MPTFVGDFIGMVAGKLPQRAYGTPRKMNISVGMMTD